jgi:hypothetical protein
MFHYYLIFAFRPETVIQQALGLVVAPPSTFGKPAYYIRLLFAIDLFSRSLAALTLGMKTQRRLDRQGYKSPEGAALTREG